jgi:hypothetical protein
LAALKLCKNFLVKLIGCDGHFLAAMEAALLDIEEGFKGDCDGFVTRVCIVDVVDDGVELGVFGNHDNSLEVSALSKVVGVMLVVELTLHKELENSAYVH